ncbi:MAG TPA: hypothetical protein PLB62_13815, partial [Candidatus Sumerlaeota bacterium]|nr:hypothetical protein [Candidatus Sumerlaeota bacterium]
VKIHYSGMITYLDEAMKKNDPEYLARAIGDAEFAVDWHEVQAMLLHLKSHGVLTAEAQLEAKTLWEAAETFKRESLSEKPEAREEARKAKDIFYQHRSRLFDLLKTRTAP